MTWKTAIALNQKCTLSDAKETQAIKAENQAVDARAKAGEAREEAYKALGVCLIKLKKDTPRGEWMPALVKHGIASQRASEAMRMAGGALSMAEHQTANTSRQQKSRANSRDTTQRHGNLNESKEPPARAKPDLRVVPTVEETASPEDREAFQEAVRIGEEYYTALLKIKNRKLMYRAADILKKRCFDKIQAQRDSDLTEEIHDTWRQNAARETK